MDGTADSGGAVTHDWTKQHNAAGSVLLRRCVFIDIGLKQSHPKILAQTAGRTFPFP